MIDQTNRNTALASALTDELARCGVSHAVVSPGSRSTPLTLAVDRDPRIETHVVLDERSAGFVALGISLATGVPALVACTSGSAVANLHPAVVEADQAGVPLIIATNDRPPELRGIGAGQTIDQIGIFGTAARWFFEVGTHDADDAGLLHLRSTACRAFAEAVRGRGPVHLNLSWREPLGPEPSDDVVATDQMALEGRGNGAPLTTALTSRRPEPGMIEALASAINSASRPLLVVGRVPDRSLVAPIVAMAAAIEAPILADPLSQLRFGPHDRTRVVSAYEPIFRELPKRLEPDLIVRFGDLPTCKPLRLWLGGWSGDQIAIDPPSGWNEPSRRAGAMIDADPAKVASEVTASLEKRTSNAAWADAWLAADRAAHEAIDSHIAAVAEASEPAAHRALAAALADGDRLLLASSMPVRDAEAFMAGGAAEVTIHCNRGANGIDGLLSTAAGIASGSKAPTWLLIGDLALAHDASGLAAIAAAEVPVRTVVLDNGGGRIFDFLPQAQQIEAGRYERLFTTPAALRIEALAAAYGVPYRELEAIEEIGQLAEEGTVLARLRVDRDDNVELHRQLASAAMAAVGRL